MIRGEPSVFIGMGALGFAMLMCVYAVRLLSILVSSRRWASVQARLVTVDIKHRQLEDRTLRGRKVMRKTLESYQVEYLYERDGIQVRGRALNLMDLVACGFVADRRDLEEARALGDRISVWVDPGRPLRSVVFRRAPASAWLVLALLLGCAVTLTIVCLPVIDDTFDSTVAVIIVGAAVAATLHAIVRAYQAGHRS